MTQTRIVLAFLLVFASSTPVLHADNCTAIKDLKLPDTTFATADRVDSGNLDVPGIDKPLQELPVFCRVTGVLRPSADSEIRFEVWMPEKDWNNRFLGVGNGGFAGSIGFRGLAGNLRRGFATAGSDAGHQADGEDASWAFGHPEKIKDFGWRAVHLTTERAKDVVKAYYGKTAAKAYFDSCSDGGREALMEAQRFPEDYDGILAGAPANNWTHLFASGVDVTQKTTGDPHAYISAMKLPAIERAALAACDTLDGVKDGIINDPAKCHFDPSLLLCKGADSLDCLTQPQVESLKTLYAGGVDGQGKSILPGYAMGDESGAWREWILGQGPGAGAGVQYAQNYFRYMVTGNTKWNVLTANVDASLAAAGKETATALDSTNPDLRPFSARGGKLIMYHGWDDPAISPWNSIAYYQSVQKTMSPEKTESFMRLYMAPGVEHCVGGPGPSSFGQLGISTSGGPKYGMFDALVDWVEKDAPAGTVIATKYAPDNKVLMTRPLCPYPAVAKYKGTGDTNDAANFACSRDGE
jgi:tannase/feruloyl esterase